MHVWNLWGSVPPTRLRTTVLEASKIGLGALLKSTGTNKTDLGATTKTV